MERRNTDRMSADEGRDRQRKATDPMSKALGIFSLGLGLAQLAAPRRMMNLIGVEDTDRNRDTMLALGLREFASGVGILGPGDTAGWLQARVGGDIMDLALLAAAFRTDDRDRGRLNMALGAVAGVLALDVLAARRSRERTDGNGDHGQRRELVSGTGAPGQGDAGHVVRSTTIRQPVAEVYAFWRDFQNLPRFMAHLESVETTGDRRSHWVARAPAGRTVEWDAETLEDRPNELIAWRSLDGASVPNSGQVRFRSAPGGRGTEIVVELRYDPPAGKLGMLVAKLFGEEPGQQVESDLRRLKQVLETGEVLHSDASIHRGMHPAQPSEQVPGDRLGGDETMLQHATAEAASGQGRTR